MTWVVGIAAGTALLVFWLKSLADYDPLGKHAGFDPWEVEESAEHVVPAVLPKTQIRNSAQTTV